MIALPPQIRVFLYRLPTDMRRSFNGLIALTESALKQDPLSGSLFVFVNRRRDRIKILYWGQSGFCTGSTSLPLVSGRVFSCRENYSLATNRRGTDAQQDALRLST